MLFWSWTRHRSGLAFGRRCERAVFVGDRQLGFRTRQESPDTFLLACHPRESSTGRASPKNTFKAAVDEVNAVATGTLSAEERRADNPGLRTSRGPPLMITPSHACFAPSSVAWR